MEGTRLDDTPSEGVEVDVAANYSSFQQFRKAVGSGARREGGAGAA
jgi:hypothetical protein